MSRATGNTGRVTRGRKEQETGELCPECGNKLLYEMSFQDRFSYTTGHYTTDFPVIACEECDYYTEYEYEEDEDILIDARRGI